MWVEKFFGPTNIWVDIFSTQKNLSFDPKKIWVRNVFGPKKNCVGNVVLTQKNLVRSSDIRDNSVHLLLQLPNGTELGKNVIQNSGMKLILSIYLLYKSQLSVGVSL